MPAPPCREQSFVEVSCSILPIFAVLATLRNLNAVSTRRWNRIVQTIMSEAVVAQPKPQETDMQISSKQNPDNQNSGEQNSSEQKSDERKLGEQYDE